MTSSHADGMTANHYRSFLVRFWRSHEQGSWRASAQCVQTGNTVQFGDIEGLLQFLHMEITGKPNEGEADINPLPPDPV